MYLDKAQTFPSVDPVEVRQPWAPPTYRELPVSETAGNPGVGGDGGFFSDCTRS